MKTNKQIACLIFLLSVFLLSCGKKEPTTLLYPNKDFYRFDSIYPYKYLQIENYKSFQELKNDVERAVCNDSTAILEFKVSDTIKKIRLINFCFRGTHVDYRLRNTIEINNDTIIKSHEFYPIDSLFQIMKMDFNNYGKNNKFSDKPSKLVIHISYPNLDLDNMINTLKQLTMYSDRIQMNDYLHLKISEFEKIEVIEIPPPPVIDDIEVENEKNQQFAKEQIGLKFINDYIEFIDNPELNIDLSDWLVSNPNISENFKLRIKKQIDEANRKDPELGLGFDPILKAQDYPEKGFEILKTGNEYVEVNGINWPDFIMNLKMIKENGKWKVDATELE